MLRIILTLLMAFFLVLFLMSVIAVAVGAIMATVHRKEDVSLLRACLGRNILFHPDLYRAEATDWRWLYIRGFVGMFVFFAIAALIGFMR